MNVSRETTERLRELAALAEKWNKTINLVSKVSVASLWDRHILDSAQLFPYASDFDHWVDVGSGGGFPGLVVASIAKEKSPSSRFTLIESDQRKCVFLTNAARVLDLNVVVFAERIDEVEPQNGDVFSARALAQLPTLLGYASRHMAPDGIALLPKGENYALELAEAKQRWHFSEEIHTSATEPNAVILAIRDIVHV